MFFHLTSAIFVFLIAILLTIEYFISVLKLTRDEILVKRDKNGNISDLKEENYFSKSKFRNYYLFKYLLAIIWGIALFFILDLILFIVRGISFFN